MDYSEPRRLEERFARQLLQMLALLAVALLQVTMLPAPFGFPLNPSLVLVILLTLLRGTISGARLAFFSGLALDLVAATPLGSHSIALLVAVAITLPLSLRVEHENLLLPVLAVLVGSMCYEVTLAIIYGVVPSWIAWQSYLLIVVVPTALLAAIPSLPGFLLLRWWYNRHTIPEISGARL